MESYKGRSITKEVSGAAAILHLLLLLLLLRQRTVHSQRTDKPPSVRGPLLPSMSVVLSLWFLS